MMEDNGQQFKTNLDKTKITADHITLVMQKFPNKVGLKSKIWVREPRPQLIKKNLGLLEMFKLNPLLKELLQTKQLLQIKEI